MSDPIELVAALQNANVLAFVRTLRLGEGTSGENGYRTLYGGGLFDSFADHPRIKVTAGAWTSTAAGAYQILERTWDGLVKQYGFADFSPQNQDLAAVALIKGRNALDDVIAGRFNQAVMKCNKEWASLPGSPYGQPVLTLAKVRAEYERNGGTYAPVADATEMPPAADDLVGVPPPPNPFVAEESPMAPFIAAALPALINAVPELTKIFAGDKVSPKTEALANTVVTIAKSAIGARNEQELIEAMKADPSAAAAVRDAIKTNWYQLAEVGGGIQAAREANAKAADGPGFWMQPAFWVTLLLLPLVYFVVVQVLTGDNFSSEVQSMVIAAVVSGVLSALTGFWLGTSFSSSKKDDTALSLLRKV